MSIRFDDQVAIVTGAGGGLGRSHALELAARGAKVVVNDLGGSVDGSGSGSAAQDVVAEIEAAGGVAMADTTNITDEAGVNAMVQTVMDKWGRIDVLINNAGILRDKTFSKMETHNFNVVMDVHLMGTYNCTRAVWPIMREQNYGRILVTSSASGIYGNFGQSNYGAAKSSVVGLMNTLKLEGTKNNVHINGLAPVAATRMTEGLMPPEALAMLQPELVTPGVLFMVSKDAPSGEILCAGAGVFARARMVETQGVYLGGDDLSPEKVAENWEGITDSAGEAPIENASGQTMKFMNIAMAQKG
ncbi:MAG: SDR family NAD(P)-dependent oxidoreductase [Alphaproteobacteria bacterium]|nr:SDR family NAD(P)-dependent oxidoreductase [Rhodospirillales bacterium]MCW9045991.1 SDR family NAD(P)-dependent oxidoreductase [Alphaproteobacteria bacterium]